jgi:Zn-dependent peptidase ImmA (M78 family)/transcriptional regulator with XRE-family HTH domain
LTIGVTGFVGERLTEAREARGIMTKSALADLLDLSVRAVSQYENNVCNPRHEIVSRIANQLRVKEAFFFRPLPYKIGNPVFWRSRHAATKSSRVVAERKLNWAKSIADEYLKQYLELPALHIPTREELRVPTDPKSLTDHDIEGITLRLRQFWGLGTFPIPDMAVLLENNGILVTHGDMESSKLDAFSNVSEVDGSFHIFLGTDTTTAVRSRFDAAHELGHLILHSHLSKKDLEDKEKTKKHSLIERQAYRFASAFLMPVDSFRADVWMTSLQALLSLKERWKVSVGAMIMRCSQLGIIHEDQARRLWISYNRRWKNAEPKDETIPFEAPQLMKNCFDMLVESKIKTKAQILHELPYSQRDIETLMNLPEGYFSDDFGQVRHLPTFKPITIPVENNLLTGNRVGAERTTNVINFEPKKSAS